MARREGSAPVVEHRVSKAVGQHYHSIDICHLGVSPFTGCAGACVEQVSPLLMRQRAPQACGVATVADGVVHAPVGVGVTASEVVTATGTVVFTKIGRRIIGADVWLVIDVAVVPAAGAPAEQVYPAAVRRRDAGVGISDAVVLICGKAPCAGRRLVLKVALRYVYLRVFTYAELAVYCSCGSSV